MTGRGVALDDLLAHLLPLCVESDDVVLCDRREVSSIQFLDDAARRGRKRGDGLSTTL